MALYKSPYAAFQVLIRSESIQYHPATGVEISRVRPLVAEFGSSSGGEFDSVNPLSGQTEKHAMIFGHFFDSESAQEQIGWTDEERESVEATLDKLCRDQPYLIAKIDLTRPPLSPPWPTFDETSEKDVVQFAITLGLVNEALAYERENNDRQPVIAALEKAQMAREAAAPVEAPSPGVIALS